MSLYRKYRPQSFVDVVGQDAIVTTLEQAAEQDKLAHAYLFAGSRGTGKTSVARILAKILMIRGIADEALQKQIMKGVEEGTIIDLLEIDAASNRGIDDIRELVEKIQFSPVVASAKVYIIDEVHMLTKEAFNALLKTLEEPPPYAFFILATTELNKIPSTIQSRCQCFPFRRVREEDIIRRLQYIADQEHITIDRDALRTIAHHVQGGMRDAISILDQVRSLEKITSEDIEQRIGSTGQEHVQAIFTALEEKDAEAVLERVRKVEESGIPIDSFIRQLLAVVRTQLHDAVEDKEPTTGLLHIMDVLLSAIRDARNSPLPALTLEGALLSLCTKETEMKKEDSVFSKLKKAAPSVTEKEAIETKAEQTVKAEKKTDEKKPEPVAEKKPEKKAGAIEAPELTLSALQSEWQNILKETDPASVRMSLKTGFLRSVEENKVTVSFSSAFHRDKVADDEASRKVEEVMNRIFKRTLRLHCTLDTDAGNTPIDSDRESVSLAEAAAEIF